VVALLRRLVSSYHPEAQKKEEKQTKTLGLFHAVNPIPMRYISQPFFERTSKIKRRKKKAEEERIYIFNITLL